MKKTIGPMICRVNEQQARAVLSTQQTSTKNAPARPLAPQPQNKAPAKGAQNKAPAKQAQNKAPAKGAAAQPRAKTSPSTAPVPSAQRVTAEPKPAGGAASTGTQKRKSRLKLSGLKWWQYYLLVHGTVVPILFFVYCVIAGDYALFMVLLWVAGCEYCLWFGRTRISQFFSAFCNGLITTSLLTLSGPSGDTPPIFFIMLVFSVFVAIGLYYMHEKIR